MKHIKEISYYTFFEDYKDSIQALEDDTRTEIDEYLQNIFEDEFIDLINDYAKCEIHKMDDLDDVFYDYKPSEVLEDLYNIDTYDDYFDADGKESGHNIWNLANTDLEEMVTDIINRNYESNFCTINEILDKYDERKNEIIDHYENEKVRKYFEKLLYEYGKDEMFIVLSRAF